jgi:hypothetical protein
MEGYVQPRGSVGFIPCVVPTANAVVEFLDCEPDIAKVDFPAVNFEFQRWHYWVFPFGPSPKRRAAARRKVRKGRK